MGPAAILDAASEDDARAMLKRCCGSAGWGEAMLARRPFGSEAALFAAAEEEWARASDADVIEALTSHPRIGASLDELRKKYAAQASWSAAEQSGASEASEETLRALRDGNVEYEARFGHLFVVCATGKTAAEMLAILRARLPNEKNDELRIAKGEQAKITRLRLEKLGT
jgi:2-oxo-4-hydroxy-4-carboxy-5-ureidoimidazoline decarboxylase